VCPQWPWLIIPYKYIPRGYVVGMQKTCLISEHATFFDRLYDENYILWSGLRFPDSLRGSSEMCRNAGVRIKASIEAKKPEYLLLAIFFSGLEVSTAAPDTSISCWSISLGLMSVFPPSFASCKVPRTCSYVPSTYVSKGSKVLFAFLTLVHALAISLPRPTKDHGISPGLKHSPRCHSSS